MLPFDQLIKALTQEQVKASIENMLKASGLPVTSWRHEGSVVRTIVAIVAAIFAGFTEVIAVATRSGFLDLAEGIWLTLLAYYVYGVARIEATFAAGKVTLTNTGGGLFDMEAGDLILLCPSTRKTYTNVAAFKLNPLGKLDVDIRAVEVGAASTAPPNTITDFVTKLLGVEVTNAAPLVGLDAEADPALRERCRDSLGSLSPNGPAAAYRYWAKSAKRLDGSAVGVTRVRLLPPAGNGSLTVVVATATGPVSGKADDPATDLGAVYRTIQENAVPDGIGLVDVVSAVVRPVNVAYEAWVTTDSGMSGSEVESAVAARLTGYFPSVPIGGFVIKPAPGKVSWRALEGQIESVSPFVIEAKVTPEVDAVMANTEVAVLGAVAPSVHLVAAAT